MQNIINSVKGTALGFAGLLTPVLKESKFKDTGVVTPNEFVIAGDHLVHTCPTWEWACGDECKIKSYLPKDKQYLITRNVPCLRRYQQIENSEIIENIVELEEGNEGWVETHHSDSSHLPMNEKISEIPHEEHFDGQNIGSQVSNIVTHENQIMNTCNFYTKNSSIGDDDDDDDDEGEAIDMDAFVESGMLEDDSATVYSTQNERKQLKNTSIDEILKTRTYDLHITYDKFYQTPRLWIYGYNENKNPLSMEEMFEDVSHDYAKKTVTMDSHPHIPGPSMASIHPCKHAEVMKKMIKIMKKRSKHLKVHMYLIIFLKFVQSVIPTIDYDYTQNINL
ncbi:ubiquitin-like-conjugating enzyme ATG3 [Acyrthosiphon pisum]|uniref:Ubiquitin-like-conjugating enzyme ATG3 n=1 Tax=Acyrthosiphon pisum TaxID=7029 RepID=A0A8R2JUJ8_ACYPI|nr:ubiquitin-like-conjugating enzyme ATG3 [Acyrthosiphon pisum]XP_029346874.1 ubiquitin-like-conjugating enzyme ATG3 [Acyrthosiphon pisum]|eukprot:XP_001949218.2 PREDICTED: ubiquitin-like-conjugating enzyme ATG3 [Acyrthosiphon pisum]